MSEIKWTKARRKKLPGFRTPVKSDPDDAVFDPKAAMKLLATRTKQVGLEQAPDDVKHAYEQRIAGKTPDSLDAKTEAMLFILVCRAQDPIRKWEDWTEARATVALWLADGGFRFAIDVITQPRPYAPMKITQADRSISYRVQPAAELHGEEIPFGAFAYWAQYEPLYWALRNHVAHMSDEELADATSSVANLLEGLPGEKDERWWHRAGLVYVLSRDESMVNAQADRLLPELASFGYNVGEPLAAATTDLERAEKLVANASFVRYGHAFVETHGMAAKRILEAQYAERSKHSAKQYMKGLIEALKLVGVKV